MDLESIIDELLEEDDTVFDVISEHEDSFIIKRKLAEEIFKAKISEAKAEILKALIF